MKYKTYKKEENKRKKCLNRGKSDGFLLKEAKRMRLAPTEAEKLFKAILVEKHIPFEEQVPFYDKEHKYIFDFLVCKKWVVEIDGGYHYTTKQKEKDIERDNIIKKLKFKERRFTNEEIIGYSMDFHKWLNGIINGYKLN